MASEKERFIGPYSIKGVIGRGGMGTVYKVKIPVIGKVAALKCLTPSPLLVEKAGERRLREQFIREAAIIANLRHPHIVEIWSMDEAEGRLFYLMEYFCHDLGTLMGESYWADSPSRVLPAGKAVRLISEILAGLFRLHQAGIVHRDIKPFNIMLTDSGRVKIVDFGLSGKRGEVFAGPGDLFLGTKHYAAPEQVEDPASAGPRADLYSTGILFYRMLTGTLPAEDPIPPSVLQPHLDAKWDEFLFRAIEKDPKDRFPDAPTMALAIGEIFREYETEKTRECGIVFPDEPSLPEKNLSPRAESGRVLAKNAVSVFDMDELRRPRTFRRDLPETATKNLVKDLRTGLVWQRSGTDFPVTFDGAVDYIKGLNAEGFGGYGNWRLPTVNELFSLLRPPPSGDDFCLASPFSPDQKWIWSGDTRSKKAVWVVYMEMGFVTAADPEDYFFVKGVCGPFVSDFSTTSPEA